VVLRRFPPLLGLESAEWAIANQCRWKADRRAWRLRDQPRSCLPRLEAAVVEAPSPTHIEGQAPGAARPARRSRQRLCREGIDSTSAILDD
jgi:hypothetical protein